MIPRVIPRPIGPSITGDPRMAEGSAGLGLMGDPQMTATAKSLGIISNKSGDHLTQVWGSPVIRHHVLPTITNPETSPALERNSRSARDRLWMKDEFLPGVKR